MRIEPEKNPKHRLEPDSIVSDKLSTVVAGMENLLKPYQHSSLTKVQTVNGVPTMIVFIAEIKI